MRIPYPVGKQVWPPLNHNDVKRIQEVIRNLNVVLEVTNHQFKEKTNEESKIHVRIALNNSMMEFFLLTEEIIERYGNADPGYCEGCDVRTE